MFTRLVGVVSTLVLVRLLLPADFGLVTLAAGFSQAADSLSSIGVEEAVIREKDPSRALYDSAFTINVIRGAANAAVLALAAWPVGLFFGDERLIPVMFAFAAGALATAFENIGIVDFRRDIAFEKEFLLMSVPRVASVLVVIPLAFLLHSYWALIAAILTSIILRVAMTYGLHPFRPRFGLQAWRQIADFSFWSWLISLSSLTRDRCDSFIIGRVLDVAQVGIFSIGAEIAALPTTEFVSPLGRACFSTFAAARNVSTDAEVSHAYLRVLGSTALIALPAGFGISLVADPIVQLVFGPEWLDAIPVIEVLGVALSAVIVGTISMSLLNAYAVLRKMFWIQVTAVAVRVPVMIVLVSQRGLLGGAIGAGIATAFEQLLYLVITIRRLRLNGGDLLHHTWRCLAATAVMTSALVAAGLGWTRAADTPSALVIHLCAGIALGAASYAAAVAGLWLTAGQPAGAETDMFELVRRVCLGAVNVLQKQRRSVLFRRNELPQTA